MSKPQQPELRRSGQTPSLNPDAIAGQLAARDTPSPSGTDGHPVPPANRAGSRSGPVQDKPDLDAFAAKLGAGKEIHADADTGTGPGPGEAEEGRRLATSDSAEGRGDHGGSRRPARTSPLVAVGVRAVAIMERPIVTAAHLLSRIAGGVQSAADEVAHMASDAATKAEGRRGG